MAGAATPAGGVEGVTVTRGKGISIIMTMSQIIRSPCGMVEVVMAGTATPAGGAVVRDTRITATVNGGAMEVEAESLGRANQARVAERAATVTVNGGVGEAAAGSQGRASQAKGAASHGNF